MHLAGHPNAEIRSGLGEASGARPTQWGAPGRLFQPEAPMQASRVRKTRAPGIVADDRPHRKI
jgi:hypothetical protein